MINETLQMRSIPRSEIIAYLESQGLWEMYPGSWKGKDVQVQLGEADAVRLGSIVLEEVLVSFSFAEKDHAQKFLKAYRLHFLRGGG